MNLAELKIEYIPIDRIRPYERNAKKHPPEQIAQIVRSIHDTGMNDPIGIWSDKNIIVEGHGRWMACKQLGMATVPVIRLDHLTDEQRREYALIHNQTTMNSGWDFDIVDMEIGELPDFDAEFYGFDVNFEDPEPTKIENTEKEYGEEDFADEKFECECPRCGFKFNR